MRKIEESNFQSGLSPQSSAEAPSWAKSIFNPSSPLSLGRQGHRQGTRCLRTSPGPAKLRHTWFAKPVGYLAVGPRFQVLIILFSRGGADQFGAGGVKYHLAERITSQCSTLPVWIIPSALPCCLWCGRCVGGWYAEWRQTTQAHAIPMLNQHWG